ncbi:Voltage-dependent calcium channel subunit alpha-2/delta-3 [Blattella germanica]|nr:Voltage-dependent calcium channel subunit alpha-2/delta-3 [Blattella germanica]
MWCRQLIFFALLALPAFADIAVNTVEGWAYRLGEALLKLSESATGITELKNKYQQQGMFSFENKDDRLLVQEIASNIQNLTLRKIHAVKRVVDKAVQKMSQEKKEIDKNYGYYSTKNCEMESKQPAHRKKLNCLPNSHFFDACVNTNSSSVHVPNYINDKENEVFSAINWTEDLEATFISNYDQDPSLSWQYFGSSTGFMRHYPGM